MKVLILPSFYITDYKNKELKRYLNIIKSIFKLNLKNISYLYNENFVCNEMFQYADFPKVLGKENVHIVGNYQKEYIFQDVPDNSYYPSMHLTPKGTHISYRDALKNIKKYNFVLIGARSGSIGKKIINKAKQVDIPVVLIDNFDDNKIYKTYNFFENFRYKNDVDLIIKHDVPIDFDEEYIVPCVPMPVRSECYEPNIVLKKNRNFFYAGRNHINRKSDRDELITMIKNNFPDFNDKVYGYERQKKHLTFKNYASSISASHMSLSPAGKTWDSCRHAEVGILRSAPVIPLPICKLASNLKINNENSINYKINQDKKILNKNELLEKIKYYYNNTSETLKLSNNYYDEIKSNHTTYQRSKYFISEIRKVLKI